MTLTTVQRAGLGAFVIATAVLVVINLNVAPGQNGGTSEMLGSIAICAVVAAAVFRWAIPRAVEAGAEASARRALGFSVAGLLTVLFFWTGLPYVLAAAGATLGALSRERGAGGVATAAVAVGLLAAAAGIGIAIMDQLS